MGATTIRRLRDVVPLRPLTAAEALRIAEQQATLLLDLSNVASPPVPETVISTLPRIQVERVTPSFASGATQWSRGRWLIVLAGSEPVTRQRFTLAHEFKHILDHPFVRVLYPPTRARSTTDQVERVCEYFAACLLMPKVWVKRAYCDDGLQQLVPLARRFNVSPVAMEVRLYYIGLAKRRTRCGTGVRR